MKPLFRKCRRCGDWLCEQTCWNRHAPMCKQCAPIAEEEESSIRAEHVQTQVTNDLFLEEDQRMSAKGKQVAAKCPECGAPTLGKKFCPGCARSWLPPRPSAGTAGRLEVHVQLRGRPLPIRRGPRRLPRGARVRARRGAAPPHRNVAGDDLPPVPRRGRDNSSVLVYPAQDLVAAGLKSSVTKSGPKHTLHFRPKDQMLADTLEVSAEEARAVLAVLAERMPWTLKDDVAVFEKRWSDDRDACAREADAQRRASAAPGQPPSVTRS